MVSDFSKTNVKTEIFMSKRNIRNRTSLLFKYRTLHIRCAYPYSAKNGNIMDKKLNYKVFTENRCNIV